MVSIVCATYNRADVLRVAIESVVAQSFQDWEMIVVGDHCTDHTSEVVASFEDSRVTFRNRTENHGEQSVPNNEGVELACGQFIAYINHDDVWLPNHLADCITTLRSAPADLVFGGYTLVTPGRLAKHSSPTDIRNGQMIRMPPASAWLFERSLVDRIGQWKSAFDLYVPPSAEWLMRALDSGARVRGVACKTLVIIPSAQRPGSYAENSAADIEFSRSLIAADGALLLSSMNDEKPGIFGGIARMTWRTLARIVARLGVHPFALRCRVEAVLSGHRRGDFIRAMRNTRGLTDQPARMSR